MSVKYSMLLMREKKGFHWMKQMQKCHQGQFNRKQNSVVHQCNHQCLRDVQHANSSQLSLFHACGKQAKGNIQNAYIEINSNLQEGYKI